MVNHHYSPPFGAEYVLFFPNPPLNKSKREKGPFFVKDFNFRRKSLPLEFVCVCVRVWHFLAFCVHWKRTYSQKNEQNKKKNKTLHFTLMCVHGEIVTVTPRKKDEKKKTSAQVQSRSVPLQRRDLKALVMEWTHHHAVHQETAHVEVPWKKGGAN